MTDSFRYWPKTDKDWKSLEELRNAFVSGHGGDQTYFNNQRLIELYDATFAKRIAAKWRWVLSELEAVGWSPASGALLDWGCGSGVASREVLNKYSQSLDALYLLDRSKLACEFTREAVRLNNQKIKILDREPQNLSLQVLSHVISEIDDSQLDQLCSKISAQSIIWVEPGSKQESRRLGVARQKLIERGYQVVAPCFHQKQCGLLDSAHKEDWCHFFAKPLPEFFGDQRWRDLADRLKLDLYVLPVSFIVLDRRPIKTNYPENLVRVIGSYRRGKAHYMLTGCNQAGISECRFSQRSNKQTYKDIDKSKISTRQIWKRAEREILEIENFTQNSDAEGKI